MGFRSHSPSRSAKRSIKKTFGQDYFSDTCHVFSVSLGGGGGLLGVPDGLHLGQVGAVLGNESILEEVGFKFFSSSGQLFGQGKKLV